VARVFECTSKTGMRQVKSLPETSIQFQASNTQTQHTLAVTCTQRPMHTHTLTLLLSLAPRISLSKTCAHTPTYSHTKHTHTLNTHTHTQHTHCLTLSNKAHLTWYATENVTSHQYTCAHVHTCSCSVHLHTHNTLSQSACYNLCFLPR